MHQLNNVTVTGNLANDPKFGETHETTWARIQMVNNRTWRDRQSGEQKEEATFLTVVAFGGPARGALHLGKGDRITVKGRLKQATDRDGQPTYRLEIVAQKIHFDRVKELDKRGE